MIKLLLLLGAGRWRWARRLIGGLWEYRLARGWEQIRYTSISLLFAHDLFYGQPSLTEEYP